MDFALNTTQRLEFYLDAYNAIDKQFNLLWCRLGSFFMDAEIQFTHNRITVGGWDFFSTKIT